MNKAMLAVGLSAALQMVIAGCCLAPQTKKDPCAELRRSNDELTNRNKALEDSLAAKQTEVNGLQNQVTTKDARIAALMAQLNQPAPPQPAAQGPTGFEGTGEVTRDSGKITVSIATDLLFDSGKATLKTKGALTRIAEVINDKYAGKKIRVRGHTDSDPIRRSGWKDNWDLGFNRARAVALQLMSDGVPENRLEMDSLSDTEPRGSSKAQNRRVEIQVVLRE